MFGLYFFDDSDATLSPENVFNWYKNPKNSDEFSVVKEGEFDTFDQAIHRLDTIGSRWIFYPNSFIVKGDQIVGIYYADGVNFEFNDNELIAA